MSTQIDCLVPFYHALDGSTKQRDFLEWIKFHSLNRSKPDKNLVRKMNRKNVIPNRIEVTVFVDDPKTSSGKTFTSWISRDIDEAEVTFNKSHVLFLLEYLRFESL